MIRRILIANLTILSLLVTGCSQRKVQRIDPSTQTDLSGRWNDTDARQVAEEITKDVTTHKWINNFMQTHNGRKPVIIISLIKNNTDEHIDPEVFIKNMERSFINDGTIRIVQGADFREKIREERADQQKFASLETQKKWGKELGADFMMTGQMASITDAYKKQTVKFYQINLELSDLETNEKVWIGEKQIKKAITD